MEKSPTSKLQRHGDGSTELIIRVRHHVLDKDNLGSHSLTIYRHVTCVVRKRYAVNGQKGHVFSVQNIEQIAILPR